MIKHVAIIMDGNGRWANQRLRPRVWGHVRGSYVVSDIVESADNLGVECLTLYAFSQENWSRPSEEIKVLFRLLKKFLNRERAKIIANNIQFKIIGDIGHLPESTRKMIQELESVTGHNTGLKLTFAFSYSGRNEIVHAVNRFIADRPGESITEECLKNYFFRPEIGDVDLLIRTGGEQRISNFLMWQMAYAEFYFTPTKWPDFSPREFEKILHAVGKRERRFGGLLAKQEFNKVSELPRPEQACLSIEAL